MADTHTHALRQERRDASTIRRQRGYGRYAKIALLPFRDPDIGGSGAAGLLAEIVSLIAARRGHTLVTSVASLATLRDRDASTIRRQLHRLDDAQYLWMQPGRRRGEIVLSLTSKARPAPYESDRNRNMKRPKPQKRPDCEVSQAKMRAINQPPFKKEKEAQEEGATVAVRPPAQPRGRWMRSQGGWVPSGGPTIPIPGRPLFEPAGLRREDPMNDKQRAALAKADFERWAERKREAAQSAWARPYSAYGGPLTTGPSPPQAAGIADAAWERIQAQRRAEREATARKMTEDALASRQRREGG